MNKKKWLILFSMLVLPFCIYTYFSKLNHNFVKLSIIGPEGHKIPEFSFINQNNDTITNEDYEDNIYIANFIFTSCPSVCPTMTMNMRYIQEKLKKYSKKMRIKESNFNFVTGDKKEIYKIAESYFVNVAKDELAPGGFLHSEYLILIDKDGRVRSGYKNFICSKCNSTSKRSKTKCPSCGEKNTLNGNPVGSYDGTKDFVIKDLIKDVKTLLAEYHEDAKVTKHSK